MQKRLQRRGWDKGKLAETLLVASALLEKADAKISKVLKARAKRVLREKIKLMTASVEACDHIVGGANFCVECFKTMDKA